jgi:hypothetical protein
MKATMDEPVKEEAGGTRGQAPRGPEGYEGPATTPPPGPGEGRKGLHSADVLY